MVTAVPLTVLAVLLSAPPATASRIRDFVEPVLRVGNQTQKGSLEFETWASADGGFCSAGHSDGVGMFPKGLAVGPAPRGASLRMRRAQRPREVFLQGWRAADEDGFPVGRPEEVPFSLRSFTRNEVIAGYRLRFEVDPDPDLYLRLYVEWKDQGGCGVDELAHLFHVNSSRRE